LCRRGGSHLADRKSNGEGALVMSTTLVEMSIEALCEMSNDAFVKALRTMPKVAQEAFLLELANVFGRSEATKLMEDEYAKSIIKRFRITSVAQLAPDLQVRPMISAADRKLVLNYLEGIAK
jgi:hypothetical protein